MGSGVRKLVLTVDVPIVDGKRVPPTEFLVFAFGETDTVKGAYRFDQDAAAAVMAAFKEYGNRLTLDYEHMALSDPPQIAPAAGSFVPELRADGLYATDVRWTPRAAEMLAGGEYLYFSPAFRADEENRPVLLINIALTNIPATKHMEPLVAASAIERKPMKKVLEFLSLKADADEAEALSAVHALRAQADELVKAAGKATVQEAIGVIVALKAKAEKADALEAQVQKLTAEKAQAEMTLLLDEAVRDGRVAPAKRADMEKLYAEHGSAALQACLANLPKAAPAAVPSAVEPAPSAEQSVSAEQLKMLRNVGLTPEQFAKAKQEHRARMAQLTGGEDF